MRRCWRLAGESIIYTASDGSPYEKRVDAKGRILSDESIADEVPFELPDGWCWARLETVFEMRAGQGIKASEISDIPTGDSPYPCFGGNGIRGYVSKPNTVGDYPIIGRQGALCGNINRATGGFYATEHAVVARCFAGISVDWACVFLEALNLNQYATATAQPGLAVSKIAIVLIPLPPLAEQRRIAERVEELMPLIDRYGELEDAREGLDAALPDRLRRSVLREAVRGRLAPQDPSDEPASELLGRIRAERHELAAEGKAKLPKDGDSVIFTGSDGRRYEKRVDARGRESDPVCIEDEIPFEIPEGWAWARLKSLGAVVGGGTPKTSDATLWAQSDNGIPWITPADMKNVTNMQVSHGARYLSEKGLCASSAQLIPAGSIVMSSRAPIGYLAITACEVATNQGFKSLVPVKRSMNRWILICLDAQMMDIQRRASGTTFKEISGTEFGETLLPIAPLSEQERVMNNFNSLIDLML